MYFINCELFKLQYLNLIKLKQNTIKVKSQNGS